MALLRGYGNNGGAQSRRRRDERGRYMGGDEYPARAEYYTDYVEYDERPTARQMGFGAAYADPYSRREMRGEYARYNRRDMNVNDQHRMNSGGKHGEFKSVKRVAKVA